MKLHQTARIVLSLLPAAASALAEETYAPDLNPRAAQSKFHGPAGYEVPAGMAPGAAFGDRIQPLPQGTIRADVWGAAMTGPRVVDNGLEDPRWSYWCSSVHRNSQTGKFEMIASRWPESSPKGHMAWPQSRIVYAVADQPAGPYRVEGDEVGDGHNAWVFQAKDGRWVQYFIKGARIAAQIRGPWQNHAIQYDNRGTPGGPMTNHTFTSREDGSVLMVSRGGRIWISRDGIEPFRKITNTSPYPNFKGQFEDPCVWRDEVQYNMIVNDWYGRQAYYLRSKEGVNWTLDAGIAYTPHSVRQADGKPEQWFKLERPNVIQDESGRATHLIVAAIDTIKLLDKANDHHGSKVLVLPLSVPRRIEITQSGADVWKLRVRAEAGFAPATDLDAASIRFGPPEEIDFGRGVKPSASAGEGDDLIITIPAPGLGFAKHHFVGKLLARDRKGTPVFGFVRLPGVDFSPALLSIEPPHFGDGDRVLVPVENSGLKASLPTPLQLQWRAPGAAWKTLEAQVPPLAPYQRSEIAFTLPAAPAPGTELKAVLPAANGCTGAAASKP